MNDLQVFRNSEFGELGILLIGGKEYFPATASAKILGYANPRDAIKRHCKADGVVKHDGVSTTENQHGKATQQVVSTNYINEGNLYRLIVSSKLPAAERFERWVFDEVLPSIRKQGGYVQDMQEVITQTATVVATEVLRQILPALGECIRAAQSPYTLSESLVTESMPRKKVPGIIEKLEPELRQEVEQMLCSRRYTYSDVVKYLAEFDIKLSVMAVHRYAKSIFR